MKMTLPDTFPYKVESLEAWRGVIYENNYTKDDANYKHYRLVYRIDGTRKTLGFESIDATMKGVASLLKQLGQAKAGEVVLSNGDGARYQQAMESLAELPDPPAINIAMADFVAARKIFVKVSNPPSLRELAEFYAKRRGLNLPARTVTETVSEMLKVKRADKLSDRHTKDLENRLTRFGKDFQCQIADMDAPKLSAWLRALRLSARSQNNFRTAIQCLITFAKSCGYLPRDWNELEDVPTVKSKKGKIAIFTPEEVSGLLSHANEKLLSFIAIGAFAGLRSAEIERLTWNKVDLKRGYIHLDADIVKTNARRVVPIQPNLREWITPHHKKQGNVCVYGNVTNELLKLASAAGVEWKQNALRHSYASYRLAVTQDAAKVALEMGNSPQMIQQHYRELKTPEDGATWFAISPAAKSNVVALAS
jgi:integrase